MKIAKTVFADNNAVEIITKSMRLIVVTDFGPRIAFLGKPDGNNLFLWEPGKHTRKDWDLRGGHRVWATTPMADECEDTYASDNEPCEIQMAENGFKIIGAENPDNGTCRGIEVEMLDDQTVSVDNFLINTSELLYSGGIWGLTCTLPKENCRYAVPVGDGSSWDAFTLVNFREWGGHGQAGFDDPQFSVKDDLFILTPRGQESKRMIQSHRGMVAMTNPVDKITFAKKVDYDPAGQYPLNTNIALYVGPGNFMVEMETMGPEKTLKPGRELHHIEIWRLADEAVNLSRAADLEDFFA